MNDLDSSLNQSNFSKFSGATSFASDKTRYYHKRDQFKQTVPDPPSYNCCFVFCVYILSITAGLLQGYQVGIIAGLELFIKDEYKDMAEKVESHERELFVSLFSLGAAFSSLFAGSISDYIGRKWVIIAADIFIGAGFLVIAFCPYLWCGLLGRVLSGIGSGLLSFIIPVYLEEMGPPGHTNIV